MNTEFSIFRVISGKESRAQEWMKLLADRRVDCNRKSIYSRIFFTTSITLMLYSSVTKSELDNAFFIEYFNQAAKPDVQYILINYSRSAKLSTADLSELFAIVDKEKFENNDEKFLAPTLILDRKSGRSVRVGSSRSCYYLIIRADDSKRCDEKLYNSVWDILEKI